MSNSSEKPRNISEMFSLLEENKRYLDIESYLLSQTTLEQVFMSFANKSQVKLGDTESNDDEFIQYSLKRGASAKRIYTVADEMNRFPKETLYYASDECILVSYATTNGDENFTLNSKHEFKLWFLFLVLNKTVCCVFVLCFTALFVDILLFCIFF